MLKLFVILQKYDFSSKSQLNENNWICETCCLWYCKSTIFQANHNLPSLPSHDKSAVCDTAKVRFFKQITTIAKDGKAKGGCLWYCKSTIFQANHNCRGFQNRQILLFVILQKYDFSSKSQQERVDQLAAIRCLWYCKSTIFQANHNKVLCWLLILWLFVILQKYDFSSKSQLYLAMREQV